MSYLDDLLANTDTGTSAGNLVGAGLKKGANIATKVAKAPGAGLNLGGNLIGANWMKLNDPGYEVNKEVVDNARIAGDNYANYRLPGYQQLITSLDRNFNDSFSHAQQGASSSGDVLDAANKLQLGKDQQLEKVAAQNAQGKQSALMQYLAAKAAAGAEMQDKNTYDRSEYEKKLQLKNQLYNNATLNQYGAADQAGKLVAALFSNNGATNTAPVSNVTKGTPLFNNGYAGNNDQSQTIY